MAPRLHHETEPLPSPATLPGALPFEGTAYDGLHYRPHATTHCETPCGAALLADDPCVAGGGGGGPERANQYYRARYYDPQAGRFISEDPIGFGGGVKFYGHVGNSPATAIDPLGLVQFVLDERNPAKAGDYAKAYDRTKQLRATLKQEVKDFFRDQYGVDIDALLAPGGLEVRLARQGCEGAGSGECRGWHCVVTLNLDRLDRDGDLFGAHLLHELTHYYLNRAWTTPDLNLGEDAAAFLRRVDQQRGKTIIKGHELEPFLPEYYPYGGYLTYGGGK
jgi:hypothetical protein